MMVVFGWQNDTEARTYIRTANRLEQAAVALKAEQNVQVTNGMMSN